MEPYLSYTIGFSQRTGSTLLCKALESTGVAGQPAEWLHHVPTGAELYMHHGVNSPSELQTKLWELGSTPNRVFGLKHGITEPHFGSLIETFRQFPGCNERSCNRGKVWGNAFPNSKHIFMTRRNKVRLAVSWWKAIQTKEWHREHGTKPTDKDVRDRYSFDAINALYIASVMREAGTQEFFTEASIVPFTVVYEDFIQRYKTTVFEILAYLGIPYEGVTIAYLITIG
jgi:trehalose 2-sulfotransferase